jgi:hypothetical protein
MLLLAIQTVGAVIVYWKGIPLYRQLEADPSTYAVSHETAVWSIVASTLIQVGYWTRYRLRPAMPHPVNVFGGHVLLFVARLVFVLATAAFSFVFITQEIAAHMPPLRYVLVLVVLFSLFCYMQELQHLGNAMLRGSHAKD